MLGFAGNVGAGDCIKPGRLASRKTESPEGVAVPPGSFRSRLVGHDELRPIRGGRVLAGVEADVVVAQVVVVVQGEGDAQLRSAGLVDGSEARGAQVACG